LTHFTDRTGEERVIARRDGIADEQDLSRAAAVLRAKPGNSGIAVLPCRNMDPDKFQSEVCPDERPKSGEAGIADQVLMHHG